MTIYNKVNSKSLRYLLQIHVLGILPPWKLDELGAGWFPNLIPFSTRPMVFPKIFFEKKNTRKVDCKIEIEIRSYKWRKFNKRYWWKQATKNIIYILVRLLSSSSRYSGHMFRTRLMHGYGNVLGTGHIYIIYIYIYLCELNILAYS